jgi:TolB-like protein/Flp pilus assembly protein TadD
MTSEERDGRPPGDEKTLVSDGSGTSEPAPSSAAGMVGRTISHYSVVDKLGGGGMGVVYKAHDATLGRFVALKFLPIVHSDDPVARQRFIREARAASALDHANICTVHEIGETDDGHLFICMGYYEGETLAQRLSRGPLPVEEAVSIARQIARGLARAHQEGIVHRDIKPANIMLTSRGEVKILDFGLASLADDMKLTRAGTTVGTVPYMSPEQVRGEELDPLTDLWSLGAVLYESLTGKLPFRGSYQHAVLQAILERDPEAPSTLRPEVSAGLEGVVLGLLKKERSRRLPSAERVLDLLQTPDTGTPEGAPTTVAAAVRRRRAARAILWRAGVALLGLALLAAVGLVAGRIFKPAHPPGSIAVMPFANFTGDAALDAISEGIGAGLITRLSEVQGLQVSGRSEAWRLRGKNLGAEQIGSRLGVATLLEGAVSREADRLKVSATLVDTGSGRVLWSEELAGAKEDLFALQKQIADRLVSVLSISLTEREKGRLARDPTTSFQAYEAYLSGERALERLNDASGTAPAIEMFREAIRRDPDFALAYTGLSEALWEKARREGHPADVEQAREAAQRALALDPDLPAGKVALARTYRWTGQVSTSIAELEKVLATHPNPDEAERELAFSYEQVGDLQAAEASLRAATTVRPNHWQNWNELGGLLWKKGNYDEATDAFQKAAAVAPQGISKPQENLAAVEVSRGHFDEAIKAYERIKGPIHSANLASNIGTAFYFSNRQDKWTKCEHYYRLAVQLNPRSDQVQRNLADLYAHLGRKDDARAHYLAALDLVEQRLTADPSNLEQRLRRAFYAAHAGRCDQAVGWADGLALDLPEGAENVHRLAYVYALCGEKAKALAQVKRALDMGIAANLLREEDEFASLRDDPTFKALVDGK